MTSQVSHARLAAATAADDDAFVNPLYGLAVCLSYTTLLRCITSRQYKLENYHIQGFVDIVKCFSDEILIH